MNCQPLQYVIYKHGRLGTESENWQQLQNVNIYYMKDWQVNADLLATSFVYVCWRHAGIQDGGIQDGGQRDDVSLVYGPGWETRETQKCQVCPKWEKSGTFLPS